MVADEVVMEEEANPKGIPHVPPPDGGTQPNEDCSDALVPFKAAVMRDACPVENIFIQASSLRSIKFMNISPLALGEQELIRGKDGQWIL